MVQRLCSNGARHFHICKSNYSLLHYHFNIPLKLKRYILYYAARMEIFQDLFIKRRREISCSIFVFHLTILNHFLFGLDSEVTNLFILTSNCVV